MSLMKIFTNPSHEIKALYSTHDSSLTCYEIDREEVFGEVSDTIIMGYKYEPIFDEEGNQTSVVVTPYVDLNQLKAAEAGIRQVIGDTSEITYIDMVTLPELIASHKKALNRVMQGIIYAGFDLGGHHYSLTDQDQTNISRWVTKLKDNPNLSYIPYHYDGGNCEMIPRALMIEIGNMSEAFVFYHLTRVNRLHRMVEECTRKRDVLAIQYDTTLPYAHQKAIDDLYLSMGIKGSLREVLDQSLKNCPRTSGEIYSNGSSMIDTGMPVYVENAFDIEHWEATKLEPNNSINYRYSIPCSIVDDDKIPEPLYGETEKEYVLPVNFFRMYRSADGYNADSEYITYMILTYRRNLSTGNPEIYVDIADNIVLEVSVPSNVLVRSTDDAVNDALTFYIINLADNHKITTDIEDVREALGCKEPPEVEINEAVDADDMAISSADTESKAQSSDRGGVTYVKKFVRK